jgi:hypothetical protein
MFKQKGENDLARKLEDGLHVHLPNWETNTFQIGKLGINGAQNGGMYFSDAKHVNTSDLIRS